MREIRDRQTVISGVKFIPVSVKKEAFLFTKGGKRMRRGFINDYFMGETVIRP